MRHSLSWIGMLAVLTLVSVGATRLLAQRDNVQLTRGVEPALASTAEDEPPAEEAAPLQTLAASLAIFVLAIFIGFEVIAKVPPTLHTPLMSGSNAISGITIVGAIIVTGLTEGAPAVLGMLAIALAAVNVVGGFLVTHRMLGMFRRK